MGLAILTCQGNLTKDPEMKTTPTGANICRFTIAVNKVVRGEKRASFISCQAFGKQGETIHRYAKKGHELSVSGEFEMWRWTDKEGRERDSPQCSVYSFSFGAKPKSDDTTEEENPF